eukprot:gene42661-41043_t
MSPQALSGSPTASPGVNSPLTGEKGERRGRKRGGSVMLKAAGGVARRVSQAVPHKTDKGINDMLSRGDALHTKWEDRR